MSDQECMKCGSITDVVTFTLSDGPETVVVELCSSCSRPIREFMELGDSGPPGSTRTAHAVIAVD